MIITLLLDSKKTSGIVKHLRFRLRDTGIDIKYRSDIQASVDDLKMFDTSGRPKKSARFGNYNEELAESIDAFMSEMMVAYNQIITSGMPLTYDTLRATIENAIPKKSAYEGSWLEAWSYMVDYKRDTARTQDVPRRWQHLSRLLFRFSMIYHLKDYRVIDITAEHIQKLEDFLLNEYLFVSKYPRLYTKRNNREKTITSARAKSTVVFMLRRVRSFFAVMVERDVIPYSPFDKLLRDERAEMMKVYKPSPIFLRYKEFVQIKDKEVPESLQMVKDMFVLQCTLGSRISDFVQINKDRICVNEDGVPFLRYVASKTSFITHDDIETPLLHSSVATLKKYGFSVPVKKGHQGATEYNIKIRELLKYCGINRGVKVWNETTRQNSLVPLYEVAGTKLCRKTHEDMMVKVQLNLYTTGLHAVGSEAINNYTRLELIDRYKMMCLAFDEPIVYYDDELNEKSTDASRTSAS